MSRSIRRCNWAGRAAAVAILAIVPAGCGYGPPERYAVLNDYRTPPAEAITLAVREYHVVRPPKGLSAFPDGGVARRVGQGVELSLCTAASRRSEPLVVVRESPQAGEPSEIGTAALLDWGDTTARLRLVSGRETTLALPAGARGRGRRWDDGQRGVVIPECAAALDELRRSRRLPDGGVSTY